MGERRANVGLQLSSVQHRRQRAPSVPFFSEDWADWAYSLVWVPLTCTPCVTSHTSAPNRVHTACEQ